MRLRRITLSGYYGFGNAGDEAVLAGLVQSLRAQHTPEELDIVALSLRPDETEAAHGIRAAHRYRVPALLSALSRTDLLLSGGGSLLQDVTSAHGIFYYLGVVRLAQRLGKKTMFIAQGIGPLTRPRSRKLVAAVANKLDAVTVRDEASAVLLREIGVRKPSLEVTADPALLLSPARQPPALDGNWFAVALRPWQDDSHALATKVAEAARRALPQAHPLLVPMQPNMDTPIAEQFLQIWHQRNGMQATVLSLARPGSHIVPLEVPLENFAACRLVIGMRLHALIIAAACGVPSVALSYDPKVTAFMEQSGQSDAIYDLESAAPDALAALLAKAWAERVQRTGALQERLPTLRAAANRNAEVALKLLA